MTPRSKVEFIITGIKISPDKITDLIAIKPSRTWLLGESIQGTKLRRKHNGWCLSTNYENSIDLAKPIQSLLPILLPQSETIIRVCNDYGLECEFSCVAYVTNEMPSICFDQEIISGLANLGAMLDIDVILTA
jgi:hypothetical protein